MVVIHDVLGISQDLSNQAGWLAGEGYLAVAPDLFHGRGTAACMIMRQARAGRGGVLADIEAMRAWPGVQRNRDCDQCPSPARPLRYWACRGSS